MKRLLRFLVVLVGLAAVAFAVDRWIWFQSVPASSWTRRCGNCQAAALWVSLEIGVAGFLAAAAVAASLRPHQGDIVLWMVLALGILTTPAVVGVLPFAIAAGILVWRLGGDLATRLLLLLRRLPWQNYRAARRCRRGPPLSP